MGCLVFLSNWVPGDGEPLWCFHPKGTSITFPAEGDHFSGTVC